MRAMADAVRRSSQGRSNRDAGPPDASRRGGSSSASATPSEAQRRNLAGARSAPALAAAVKAEPKPKSKAKVTEKAKARPPSFDEELLPIPHGLLCVICREIFKEPVFTNDGHTYCRSCIQEWFKAHDARIADFYKDPANIAPYSRKVPPNLLAPMTQLPLHNRNLQPNIALKQAVEAFCETRPGDERRERERQKLQKAVQEAQATEGALKSTYTKEVRVLQGQVQNLEEELGQVKNDLEAVKEETHKLNQMTAAKEGFHNPFLELELEELDRELPVYSAEELGLMNLPYATEQPCFERPRFGRPRSQSM
ncbi:unnamed protein product [Durusdinium trenchii]|uniref:U-box domain-containing protein 35 (Plant U-box protein 35) n=3 Tax=Durusdinium trenchii TaxID=1381693 RepID=A0ABP0S6J5_9DINO